MPIEAARGEKKEAAGRRKTESTDPWRSLKQSPNCLAEGLTWLMRGEKVRESPIWKEICSLSVNAWQWNHRRRPRRGLLSTPPKHQVFRWCKYSTSLKNFREMMTMTLLISFLKIQDLQKLPIQKSLSVLKLSVSGTSEAFSKPEWLRNLRKPSRLSEADF